ncbi:MAG TPA: type II toxin-antitoxin system VapC family toxin [Acidimicrobiales bacterium]|nr:type II toxin-antitoxin system VapC family toxin [Acidimicrobiales bacterium]
MITYVDTSALLKLVVDEEGSDRAELIWDAADALASASLVVVEARAALASATRAGRLTAAQHDVAKAQLVSLVGNLHLVQVTDELIANAAELAESEGLRGYDAVHLAAALFVSASVLTSADGALCDAASRRGLHVANPRLA